MRRFKSDMFKCYEGHLHVTSQAAQRCDQDHWKSIERDYPALAKPLEKYPAPPPGEQVEAFPDFIRK